MTLQNLIPGQYQIGDLVFGRGTTVPVELFDIKSYDVNDQDYQVARSDERRFGWDQLVPTTIEITFHVMNNWLLPPYEDTIPNFWEDMPTVTDFAREWKSEDIRNLWGVIKPLYICGKDGTIRTVFGRCGQFTYAKDSEYALTVQCLGVFRRSDTLAYSPDEHSVAIPGSVVGTNGDAPSWFRIELAGPATNPTFALTGTLLGDITIELDYVVGANEVIEINGYPWSRRCVSDNGNNLSASLIGSTPFLDRLRFDSEATLQFSHTGGGTAVLLYRDAYQLVG